MMKLFRSCQPPKRGPSCSHMIVAGSQNSGGWPYRSPLIDLTIWAVVHTGPPIVFVGPVQGSK